MFYSCSDKALFWRVALAVSTDARHWTKVPGKADRRRRARTSACRQLRCGLRLRAVVVKERDQLYRMWYRGCQTPQTTHRRAEPRVFGYAESNDGRTWSRSRNLVHRLGGPSWWARPASSIREGLATPSVFLDGNIWTMYYAAFDTNGLFLTGLARAPR